MISFMRIISPPLYVCMCFNKCIIYCTRVLFLTCVTSASFEYVNRTPSTFFDVLTVDLWWGKKISCLNRDHFEGMTGFVGILYFSAKFHLIKGMFVDSSVATLTSAILTCDFFCRSTFANLLSQLWIVLMCVCVFNWILFQISFGLVM